MKLTRTDRAWLVTLLNQYDTIEIGIKASTHYSREYEDVIKCLKHYIKEEWIEE